jgi:lysine-N-methylase
MKLYAPSYYKDFECIADRCTHSCCIGWEIDIDEETLEKYKKLKNGYGPVIMNSISFEGTPHFKLCENDRCPHLDKKGLCKIILNYGKDHLCQICSEHPRFYNYTSVAEVGIGMSCEESARIILTWENYDEITEVGQVDADTTDFDFDGRALRHQVYEILKNETQDYEKRLEAIYSKYKIDKKSDSYWLEALDALEYLDNESKLLFQNYSSKKRPRGKEKYQERLLAYFIYRHCT